MCWMLTRTVLSSEWRCMKSHIIQKPVAVILGNAGNIGCLVARAFACQGTAVAMLHESGEESSRVVDCLPGSNHFAMSGRLDHSPDLASFAGLVHALYGRVDYLVTCEDASVEVTGLNCSARGRLSVLLEHAFVSGAMVVHLVSRPGGKMGWRNQGRRRIETGMEDCLSRSDVRMNQVVIHRPVFRHAPNSRLASSACAAVLFLCGSEGRHIHREYIVVNGRRAAWRQGARPETSLSFLKSYLEFCSACSRTVFLDA